LQFKSDRVAAEWSSVALNQLLKGIVMLADEYALTAHTWPFFITCVYRTPAENDACYGGHGDHLSGVHVEWRGVDVRTRDQDPSAVMDVTTWVNDRWSYDPTRPGMKVCLNEGEGPGSTGNHLHFQVHPRTVAMVGSDEHASG
jgi:hypothetical protein